MNLSPATAPAIGTLGGPPPAPAARLVRLLLFGTVAVVSVFFGFLAHDVSEAQSLVERFGYYSIAFTFAWAVVALAQVLPDWWRERPETSARQFTTLVGTVLALTLVAALTTPYTYKVLYDEFVLQATAQNLHQAREIGTAVRGYDIEGAFRVFGTYLDKRPFFFAFLVSLLHDLTGYREANAFALNTALMPAVLGLLYLVARRLMAHRAALSVVVCAGAFSLLAHNATGAGMEMLNLAMLLLVTLLAAFYLDAPDERRLAALILATVLLAQTRYESSLYVGPVALVVLEGWRRARRVILPAAAMLAPALLIPYALHSTYLSGTPALWELRPGQEERFSVEYLPDNLINALRFFFDFTGVVPNSWWLGVAGLPALAVAIFFVVRAIPRWRQAPAGTVAVTLIGGGVCANLGLLMFYYWAALNDPIAARLSLPFCLLVALCLGWLVEKIPVTHRGLAAGVVAGGALVSYLTTGLWSNAHHWEQNLLMREIAWEAEVVDSLPPGRRLIVSNKSTLYWTMRERSGISITRARWRAEAVKFHLDHHTFDEVLVMQIYRPVGADGGFQLEPADRLPDSYVLEPVTERRFGSRIARISRVREIRLDAVPSATVNEESSAP